MIYDRPNADRPAIIIAIIVGFVAAFVATQTENVFFKILCGGSGVALIIAGLLELWNEGEKE